MSESETQPDTPLFKLLTLQTVLPLTVSEVSVSIIVGFAERSGYDFTSSVETITAKELADLLLSTVVDAMVADDDVRE